MTTAIPTADAEYFDLRYSNEPASYYVLILEIDRPYVRALWYHRAKNLVTGFASYRIPSADAEASGRGGWLELLQRKPFLRSEFEQTVVMVRTENYQVTPRVIQEESASLFEIANSKGETQMMLFHDLVNMRAGVRWATDKELVARVSDRLAHALAIPHIAPILEHAHNALKHRINRTGVFVHISAQQADVLVFEDRQLKLCNSFYQSGAEDVAYYVLYCAEVLGIQPETEPLWLSGQVKPGDSTWSLLGAYWKTIHAAPALSGIEISNALGDYPPSMYHHLTYGLLCAS